MANSISVKTALTADDSQVAPSDAQAVERGSSTRAYRLQAANSIGSRPSGRNVLAATALLCFALYSLGIRFGRFGSLLEQSRESGDTKQSVAADRFSILRTTKEHEERIAALSEAIKDTKQSLHRRKELEAHTFAKALEGRQEVLQREAALATKQEKAISDKNNKTRIAHESEISALKDAIDSLVEAITKRRIKLEAMAEVETHVNHFAPTLKYLEARASDLEKGIVWQRWSNMFDDASLTNVLLRDDFRRQQAGILVSAQLRTWQLVKDIHRELRLFRAKVLQRSVAARSAILKLEGRLVKVLEHHHSASELVSAQMPTGWDIIRNVGLVKLGVSEVLNNYQLEWEASQARKVCQLEGKEVVGELEASEFETKRLEALKEELRFLLANVQRSKDYQEYISAVEVEANWLLQDCKLEANPDYILVRGFKRVDSDEADQGADAAFRVLRARGSGASGVVVEVVPVDEKLKEEVGILAMKILREETENGRREIETVMQRLESAFLSEKSALRKVALEGEGMAAVTERTGVIGALYVGRVEGLSAPIETFDNKSIVRFDYVTFSPVIASDIIQVFQSSVRKSLSMEARVYMAHSLLRTIAYIHYAGVVHNDIKVENAGITADGRIVVFDCANFEKPGARRIWTAATNISPETAELCFRRKPRTGSYREDAWGLGFMLYTIFTQGVEPFRETDPDFVYNITSYRAANAHWLMHNVESSSFQLRRYGVPDIWIQAVSLLLERNGQHRPTVMQVLQAFPDLREGPFKTLDNGNKAL